MIIGCLLLSLSTAFFVMAFKVLFNINDSTYSGD